MRPVQEVSRRMAPQLWLLLRVQTGCSRDLSAAADLRYHD
jgi:hypothetical protein